MTVLPQFPLGTVLFPSMMLPLHIFEPRYRALVHDILDADRSFGVVMIERGHETGGADQRSSHGTVARVLQAEEFPDGRWALITVGTERFRVTEWLPDDPYPRAEIELWPDADGDDVDPDEFADLVARFHRCMALASEAGVDVGSVPDSFDGPELSTMQMAALLPIGPFDKQKLLAAPGSGHRMALLTSAIDETMELINMKLFEG